MTDITDRELRHNTEEILRRVANGETLRIISHGEPVAKIEPVVMDELERLVENGSIRRAQKSPSTLTSLRRSVSDTPSARIIADVRGD